MTRLAIIGASGHGKVVADTADCAGDWSEIVFFDDNWPEKSWNGKWEIIGNTNNLLTSLDSYNGVFVAIGDNMLRKQKLNLLADYNAPIVTIIHPLAIISQSVELGIGCAVFAGSVIQIDSKLGDGCILNTGATVDHDCILGSCVHISPGAHLAGGVTVGDYSWIGIGACVKQKTTIGSNAIIGAGSVVVNTIANNVTVVGSPAHLIEKKG